MNLSILKPSASSPHLTVLFTHFTNPTSFQLSTTKTWNSLTRKHRRNRLRYQISTVRCSASTSSNQTPPNFVTSDVFGSKKELTGIQALVTAMSPPVRLTGSALVFAVAVAAGYSLELRFGGSRNAAAVGGAVALGAAGAGAAYALNSCAPEVAAVNLHSYVANSDDPAAWKKEDMEAIAN